MWKERTCLNIKLSRKIIQDLCGTVSFKKGEAFYRANKVNFNQNHPDYCEAIVTGTEDFYVIIEKDRNDGFHTKCSCPSLASYQKDCQHIAAVLLAIFEQQQRKSSIHQPNTIPTEGLMSMFHQQPIRMSGHQLHFENRQVLNVLFICKLFDNGNGQYLVGIEMKIGETDVLNIRDFLLQVGNGHSCKITITFTYNPNFHCFLTKSDEVIKELIQITQDEKMYIDTVSNQQILLIPPSSWNKLLPMLVKAPLARLEYDGMTYDEISISDKLLPIKFDVVKAEGNRYHLNAIGLNKAVILELYSYILFEGKLTKLTSEDCKRLSNLKQILQESETNQIPIPQEQVDFFLNKVVPGLKKLGEVHISRDILEQFRKIPLLAKLYLDRIKNKLLAGIEFHYENMVMNPLENREHHAIPMLVRDVTKENEILKLMEDSSFTKTDSGYLLQNEELEYHFLYHTVPKLQKLTQIYATTAVRNRILKEPAHPKIRVKIKKERTNWLEFKFEMDGIPESQIREILQALEEKRKYYRLQNGSLLSLETREFEEIQRFLKAIPAQPVDLESELNLPIVQGLLLLDSVDESGTFNVEESFQMFLETIRNPGSLEFMVPKNVEPILRDYQKQGFKWMKTLARYGFGGILADDMGLGKTLQSITYILSELSFIRESGQSVLIVCPSSLTYNWLREIMKFAPEIEAVIIDGNKKERMKVQKEITDIDVIITSYPLLRQDINWFEKQAYHTVFFDEAQSFKNPITQTARAVKKIKADHRFALTGTPIENSLEELWSIFHVVFPNLFHGLKEYSTLSRKTIARRIRPFLLRRLKEDVLHELPEKIESIESVELTIEQKKLYAAYLAKLRHDTLKHLDKDTLRKNRIKILAGLTRLRQICCHPALFVGGYRGGSAKFEQLMQIVKESKMSGRRVLIFSQFTKMLGLIGRELTIQGLSFFYLDGQTPSEDRVEICERFNQGERDLFLISLKAGGTGLNLTGADTVILYDIWWNPAVEEQAADRAYRIGQTNEVQVIKLVSKGTIEEKMNELQEKKKQLIKDIIQSEEKAASTLTDEDIREILMI